MFDIFEEVINETATQVAMQSKPEVQKTNNLDDLDLIPTAYQICRLTNGKVENGVIVSGKKEIVDTFYCEREKNIVPNQRAIGKANILKAHDKNPNNSYVVVGFYKELKHRTRTQVYVVAQGLLTHIIHEAKA